MFQRLFRLFAVGAYLLMIGCTGLTPETVVDYSPTHDFSGDTKIAFYANIGKTGGKNPMQLTDFQKERLDKALAAALREKGLEFTDDAAEADLWISWHLNTTEKQDIRSVPAAPYGMAMGYDRYNRYAMYQCYTCFGNTEVSVREYTEGTFIVDFIDPEDSKSVWRSVTQSRLKGDKIKDQAAIDTAVRRILESFPPDKVL